MHIQNPNPISSNSNGTTLNDLPNEILAQIIREAATLDAYSASPDNILTHKGLQQYRTALPKLALVSKKWYAVMQDSLGDYKPTAQLVRKHIQNKTFYPDAGIIDDLCQSVAWGTLSLMNTHEAKGRIASSLAARNFTQYKTLLGELFNKPDVVTMALIVTRMIQANAISQIADLVNIVTELSVAMRFSNPRDRWMAERPDIIESTRQECQKLFESVTAATLARNGAWSKAQEMAQSLPGIDQNLIHVITHASQGKFDQALALAKDDPEAVFEVALAHLKNGMLDRSEACLQSIPACPRKQLLLERTPSLYIGLNQLKEAVFLAQFIEDNTMMTGTFDEIVAAYAMQDKLTEAEAVALTVRQDPEQRQRSSMLYSIAHRYLKQGNLDQATAMAQANGYVHILQSVVKIHIQRDQLEAATDIAVSIPTDTPLARYEQTHALMDIITYCVKKEAYDKVIELARLAKDLCTLVDYLIGFAKDYIAKGSMNEAIKLIDCIRNECDPEALKYLENRDDILSQITLHYVQQGQLEEALAIINLSSNDALKQLDLNGISEAYRLKGQLKQAAQTARLISCAGKRNSSLVKIVEAYSNQGQIEEASDITESMAEDRYFHNLAVVAIEKVMQAPYLPSTLGKRSSSIQSTEHPKRPKH